MERGSRVFIAVVVVLLSALLTVPTLAPGSEGLTYKFDPIVVEGNGGFSAAGFTGNGTAESPYVLRDVNLNASLELHGIRISNTTAHFRIEGCTVHDAYSPDRDPLNLSASGSGILLINVTNAVIEDYLADFNVRGITVVSSSNVLVNNSRFYNNIEAGVHLVDCLDGGVTVSNSTFTIGTGDDGLLLERCQSVKVINNMISGGENGIVVRAGGSGLGGHLLAENDITGPAQNGISLGGSSMTTGDTVVNNTVSGAGSSGVLISLGNLEIVSGNHISGCSQGIEVDWNDNQITSNLLSNNTRGVLIGNGADTNLISGNTIADGAFGILVGPSHGNQVLGNDITRMIKTDSSVGIYLGIGEVVDTLIEGNEITGCNVGFRAATVAGQEISGLTMANNSISDSAKEGAYLLYTVDSSLSNNSFASGLGNGIYLGAGCHDLVLEGNNVSDNEGAGIFLRGADDNAMTGNLLVSNLQEGVYIEASTGNLVHGNALLFNKDSGRQYSPLRPQAFCGVEGNNWSLGAGNLWADWLSPDQDDDGIVDAPYNLSGGYQDPYPLTSISGLEIPADITPPEVVAYSPQGLDAEQGDAISVTFSEDMNTSSLMVMVNDIQTNGTWNDRTFVLGVSLEFEMEYAVTVTGQDLSGNDMPELIWSFRVEDRNATITGRVIDEDGNPLEGVVVMVGGARTNTTVDGHFSLEVPPGNYSFDFLKDEYTARPLNIVVLPGEDSDVGEIEMVYDDGGASSGLLSLNGNVVIAVIILIAAGLGGFWFWRRKK